MEYSGKNFVKINLLCGRCECCTFWYSLLYFADFIANDRPLYCQYEGQSYFPAAHEYLEDIGLAKPYQAFLNKSWEDIEYEQVIFPPIPYRASRTNVYQSKWHPFKKQRVESTRWRHWLGTTLLGKDVLAGLIIGTRYALLVGILSMTIAFTIGVFLGSMAGYYGDYDFKISRIHAILNPSRDLSEPILWLFCHDLMHSQRVILRCSCLSHSL